MIQTVLVADYGTSNVRVLAVDVSCGACVASNSVKYSATEGQGGLCELDANAIWESTQLCVERTLTQAMQLGCQIRGISFSFFGDSLLPVDAAGEPVGPLILCMDPRGQEEADELTQKLTQARLIELVGSEYDFACTGAKILHFLRHSAEARRAERFYTIQQFILRKLGLPDVNDVTMACRKSLLDNRRRVWSEELLRAIGITAEQLGTITDGYCPVGSIERFGRVILPYAITVFPGAHDSDCGYVGLGISDLHSGAVAEVAGTFDHIGMIVPGYVNAHQEHPDASIWSGCGPLPQSTSCLSAYETSGALMEWFMRQIVGSTAPEAYAQLWNAAVFDASGTVSVDPRFSAGQGAISGLTVGTTRAELFAGVIETLTFETRRCLEVCNSVAPEPIRCVRIGGGGAKESRWVQLRADITGIPYQRMREVEGSALGAAILAAYGLGIYRTIPEAADHMVAVERTYEPRQELHARYEQRYQAYLRRYARR